MGKVLVFALVIICVFMTAMAAEMDMEYEAACAPNGTPVCILMFQKQKQLLLY